MRVNLKRLFFADGVRYKKGRSVLVPDHLRDRLPRDAEIVEDVNLERPVVGHRRGRRNEMYKPTTTDELKDPSEQTFEHVQEDMPRPEPLGVEPEFANTQAGPEPSKEEVEEEKRKEEELRKQKGEEDRKKEEAQRKLAEDEDEEDEKPPAKKEPMKLDLGPAKKGK